MQGIETVHLAEWKFQQIFGLHFLIRLASFWNHWHGMIKNYFKTAWRNLIRNKGYSVINIGGLSIGMAVAMLIGLWIHHEISFNRYHKNYGRIGQVMIHNGDGTYNALPIPLGLELRASYSDKFKHVVMATETESHMLSHGENKFIQAGSYMQPEAPEMFSLKMVSGNSKGLQTPNSILLQASLAKKLFGNTDPINQVVRMDNRVNVKVTGVYEVLPDNSSLKDIAFIAPFDLYISTNEWAKKAETDWKNNAFNIYVQLASGADFDQVSAQIKDLKLHHTSKEKAALYNPALFIHPMSKWHLYSKFDNRAIVTSEELKYVWFYGIIGVFVLLLASINFMNLSTARSEKRAKEVGVRKTMGSGRGQLLRLFFGESILVSMIAFILAIALTQTILPWFNNVSGKNIFIPFSSFSFWLAGIIFSILTGLLAGSYPAIYLSSFNPVKVLKGTLRAGRFEAIPRKILVVFQFTISIALITGTIIVYRQIQFAKNRPVGYTRDGLLMIDMTTPDFQGKYDQLRNELKNTGSITEMAESGSLITGLSSETGSITWQGKDPGTESSFGTIPVTYDYGKTIGWQFKDGRDFSRDFPSDSSGFVINEAAVKFMGLKNPVGQTISWKPDGDRIEQYKIIGVVNDMVMNSPFKPAYPTVFFLKGGMGEIFIKINPHSSASSALAKIETVFRKLIPSAPFAYKFVEEEYASKFAAEERIGQLSGFFSVLAIFISCLGLFGLASFLAEQRTKEIAVRKVLGASVFILWRLLSKEFLFLVLISLFIAIPLTYYFMSGWLQNYEYRTTLSWWIFLSAGMGAMIITLLTVSYHSIRAAISNPVNSLRSE